MTSLLLAIYFIVIGAIGLFGIVVDPKLVALLALIVGILLLVAPFVPERYRLVK